MTSQLSQIKWGRVALTTVLVYVISFVTVFLIVTGYATYLAFQMRGAPDRNLINAFANQYAPWIGPISLILFTFLGALWLGRRVETSTQLHGLIVGILVSLVNMLLGGAGAFSLGTLIATVLIIGAGWLAGRLTVKG